MDFNDRLILATYQNDYALVKKLIDSKRFDESIIHDIGLLYVPFPLYYITICNKKVLSRGFRPNLMPIVNEHLKNVDLLLDLWKNRFGVRIGRKIGFKQYKSYFYSDPDEFTIEDILLKPVQNYLDNGCQQIDIDLFEAVCKFQFNKVRKLLEQGANPYADLLPVGDDNLEDSWNCIDRIGPECSSLGTCEVLPQMFGEENFCTYVRTIDDDKIGSLIGWAAHEEMYDLIDNKYTKECHITI